MSVNADIIINKGNTINYTVNKGKDSIEKNFCHCTFGKICPKHVNAK